MLSRVAESIYWMARYIERAENIARFVDVNIRFNLDETQRGRDQWLPLVQITGDDELFAERHDRQEREQVIEFLAFDTEYPNSMISALRMARENARTVRETIPSEVWEQLNEFYHFVRDRDSNITSESLEGLAGFFQQIKQHSHLYNGILDATMSHGEGWQFANLGRMLERADKTSRLIDVKYFTLMPWVTDINTTMDDLHWSALLRSVSGFEMYRKRHHAITVRRVAEFLIKDPDFPRSILFCLNQARYSLDAINQAGRPRVTNLALDRLTSLNQGLQDLNVPLAIDTGMHEFIDQFQHRLNDVGAAIFETYFDRARLDSSDFFGTAGLVMGSQ